MPMMTKTRSTSASQGLPSVIASWSEPTGERFVDIEFSDGRYATAKRCPSGLTYLLESPDGSLAETANDNIRFPGLSSNEEKSILALANAYFDAN